MGRLTGLLGGTFDPPHLGHLLLAEHALDQLGLEAVLWVVTPRSPLKPEGDPAPADERCRMVVAAIADQPRFRLSRADLDRSPPHFAVDLLRALRADEPEADYVFLMGSDSLADLPRWRDPTTFLDQCSALGVFERPGDPVSLPELEAALPGITRKVRWLSAPPVAISGRDIRQRVRTGRSIRYLVPEPVRVLVERGGWYAEPPRVRRLGRSGRTLVGQGSPGGSLLQLLQRNLVDRPAAGTAKVVVLTPFRPGRLQREFDLFPAEGEAPPAAIAAKLHPRLRSKVGVRRRLVPPFYDGRAILRAGPINHSLLDNILAGGLESGSTGKVPCRSDQSP